MPAVQAIPEGFHTITPVLILKDASKAIETYKKAFGATEMHMMKCPDSGKIMHACLKIGSSMVFMCDENPQCSASAQGVSFYMYMPKVDEAFEKAKKAGFKEESAPEDMFWGDRTGTLMDSFGNRWTIASHVRDVSPEEIQKAAKDMAAKAGKGKSKAA